MSATDIGDAEFTRATTNDDLGTQIIDGQRGMDPLRVVLLAGLAIVLAIVAVLGWGAYKSNQLPAPFTIKKGEVMLDHTGGNLGLAIKVAERTGMLVVATEKCGIEKPELVRQLCGRPLEVSYTEARRIAPLTDTIEIDIPVYDGDSIDPENGIYHEAPRPTGTVSPVVVYAFPPAKK